MSIYYILDTSEYTGEESDIGDIMHKWNNNLYKETGLSLGIYRGPTTEEIAKYYGDNNFLYINEEFIQKGISQTSIKDLILENIRKISTDRQELLIIDPYLFYGKDNEYNELLAGILHGCGHRTINVITDFRHIDNKCINYIKKEFDNINIFDSKDVHDRYWIADNMKGFYVGSSLNGIGKKYCVISPLDDSDVLDIVNLSKNIMGFKN